MSEQILCSDICSHELISLNSLTGHYKDADGSKSQLYKLPGNETATESQVILNRLGRSILQDGTSADIQICPVRKKELLNLRFRCDRQSKCEVCSGTRNTKRISMLRSAYFHAHGLLVHAGGMVCRACVTNHKAKFDDWTKTYAKGENTKADDVPNVDLTRDVLSSTITGAGDFPDRIVEPGDQTSLSGDFLEISGVQSRRTEAMSATIGDSVKIPDKENRSPSMSIENRSSVEVVSENEKQKMARENHSKESLQAKKVPLGERFKMNMNYKTQFEYKESGIKRLQHESQSGANEKRVRKEVLPLLPGTRMRENSFDKSEHMGHISEMAVQPSYETEIEGPIREDNQGQNNGENVLKQSQSSDGSLISSQSIEETHNDLDEDNIDTESKEKENFERLKTFFHATTNGRLEINYKWKNEIVSDRVEQVRAKQLSNMVQVLLETIFPSGNESSYEKLIYKAFRKDNLENKSAVIIDKLIEAYKDTQSKEIKKYLLMELSLVKKFEELREIIPGLTLYQFKQAQKTIKESGFTKLPSEGYQNVSRNRRDIDSSVFFLQFMLTFVRDVSYGATEIKLSSGETVTCQNAVQEIVTEVILRMYVKHYQEEKEAYENSSLLPYPIKLFGKTTLRRLAKTIPLGALKSLRGLDYYAAAGSEAFDSMKKDLSEKVLPRASSDEDITAIQNLRINLQQAHRHLKSEFKEELSGSSPVATHCSVWSLSDPNAPEFASVCNHQHESRCSECEMRSKSLLDFKQLVEKLFPSNTFEDREIRFEMLQNINSIEEWIKHEVRGYHQNAKEKDVLESLTNRRIAHLTFDLAMKWLPRKFREPMDAWFAQRGLGWQVVLLWFRDEPNTDIQIQAFVQIFGAEKQDCFANYSCLDYTINEVKTSRPELEILSMSSDNAGNYHNNLAMTVFIPAIAEKYNLSLVNYDFKEPQKGKGPVDARIASMKQNMLVYLNSGHDVSTPSQMKDAIEAFTGVKGTKVCVVKINRSLDDSWKSKKTISGVSKMYSFEYERSQSGEWCLRYRQHSDIGRGKVLKLGKVCPISLNPTVISPYSSSASSEDTSVRSKPDRAMRGDAKAFPCSVNGCLLSFATMASLEDHISTGNHKTILDVKNRDDQTKLLFIDHINKGRVATLSYLKRLEEASLPAKILDQGWCLKTRERGGHLPEPAKRVLMELYESGKATKRKITPEEGAKILRRRFPNDEVMWLKSSQVKSQFAIMTRADKNTTGLDDDDLLAIEERQLLQQAGEEIADNI